MMCLTNHLDTGIKSVRPEIPSWVAPREILHIELRPTEQCV